MKASETLSQVLLLKKKKYVYTHNTRKIFLFNNTGRVFVMKSLFIKALGVLFLKPCFSVFFIKAIVFPCYRKYSMHSK